MKMLAIKFSDGQKAAIDDLSRDTGCSNSQIGRAAMYLGATKLDAYMKKNPDRIRNYINDLDFQSKELEQ